MVRVNTSVATKQGIQNATYTYAPDAEASDSYAITLDPAPSAYATGQSFTFKANTANTGASSLNVNGLGAKTLKKQHDQDTATGDIEAGSIVEVVYDGTNFQIISILASGATDATAIHTDGSGEIAGLTDKATPVDADVTVIEDSASTNAKKKLTWANIKATLKAYFDTIYSALGHTHTASEVTDFDTEVANNSAVSANTAKVGVTTQISNVVEDTSPQLGGTLDTNSKQVQWSKGADVASAGALTLGADGNYFDITGTTTITSIGTLKIGTVVKLHFDGALTLTHHATDLILPGGANITTSAGDEAEFVEYATGDWRCTNYTKADGTALVTSSAGDVYALTANPTTYYTYTIPFFARADVESGDDASSGWTLAGYTTGSQFNGFLATLITTGGNSFMYSSDCGGTVIIPGTGSTLAHTFASTKKLVLSFRFKGDSSGNWCVGLGTNTNAGWYTASTSATTDRAVFAYDGSTFYSITDNGTGLTRNTVTATVTNWNTFRIELDPGSACRFYVNGTLVQTHTTNLPNGGNVFIGSGHSTTGKTYYMTTPTISVEI